jgi:hypothetical protein
LTVSLIVRMPIIPRKTVGTLATSVTWTVFAGLQKTGLYEQSVTTVVVTSGTPGMVFWAPFSELLVCAAAFEAAVSGRAAAPAATAASADACRAMRTR